MKYRHIKGVAHNFAHSFVSRENYVAAANEYVIGALARAAAATGEPELRVDLLAGQAGPRPLVTPAVQLGIAHYLAWFPRLLHAHGIAPEAVAQATLRVRFDLSVTGVSGFSGPARLPYQCIVRITDDRGKAHTGTVDGAWSIRLRNAAVPPASAKR